MLYKQNKKKIKIIAKKACLFKNISYLCIIIKQRDSNHTIKKTMRTLNNIFDFAFFAAEADEDTYVLG
jgi:hypothetical protein